MKHEEQFVMGKECIPMQVVTYISDHGGKTISMVKECIFLRMAKSMMGWLSKE